MGLEGPESKRRDRRYQAGRSKHWRKVKSLKHPTMSRVKEGVLVTCSRSSRTFTEERSMICTLGRASTNSGSRIDLPHERSSSNDNAGSSLTLVSDITENLLDLF